MELKDSIIAGVPEEFKDVHKYMEMSETAKHEGKNHVSKILKDTAREEYRHGCFLIEMLTDLGYAVPEDLRVQMHKACQEIREKS